MLGPEIWRRLAAREADEDRIDATVGQGAMNGATSCGVDTRRSQVGAHHRGHP
jgi:hypothetical protein